MASNRVLTQELGKATHQYVASSQNKAKNAYKASLQAAFNYFQSQLESDQATLDALTLRRAMLTLKVAKLFAS